VSLTSVNSNAAKCCISNSYVTLGVWRQHADMPTGTPCYVATSCNVIFYLSQSAIVQYIQIPQLL